MSFLFLILMSSANVETILMAKSSRDVERQHQKTTQLAILRERCEVEIREKWIPLFCFEWLNKSSLPQQEKKAFAEFFDQRCVSAAFVDSTTTLRTFSHLKMRKGRCFEALQQKYRDHIYQGQKTFQFPDMAKWIHLGREFELSSGHAEENTTKSGRLRNHRVYR